MEEKLGDKIDRYYKLRTKRIEIEKEAKEIAKLENEMKYELIDHLENNEGLSKASGHLATVSISEMVVPNTNDWDNFWNYVHRKKAYHLLERRISATAYREELELRNGKDIPGVTPYTRKNLNMSKLTK